MNKVGEEVDHSPQAIASRLLKGPRQSYLRDWVYGGIDGAVTTFAVVTGVIGAQLSTKTILILGFANLIADGFSMAISNFLGTKAEEDERKHFSAVEQREIERTPEGEREEVRQILRAKGFEGDLLERSVDMFTSNRSRWVQFMLTEEYGLPLVTRSPWRAAFATLSAFCLCGLIPLLPFLFRAKNAFFISSLFTAIVFFAIGSFKSKWSITSWWRSGITTLWVGGMAAVLAYSVGVFLKGLS